MKNAIYKLHRVSEWWEIDGGTDWQEEDRWELDEQGGGEGKSERQGVQGRIEEDGTEMLEERVGVAGRTSRDAEEDNGREGRDGERDSEEIPDWGVGGWVGGLRREKFKGKERDAVEWNDRDCERDSEETPDWGVGGGVLKEKSRGKERDAVECREKNIRGLRAN